MDSVSGPPAGTTTDALAPFVHASRPGWIVRIQTEDQPELKVAVHGGFLSVRPDGVSILAEMAETADEIDVARAREALRRAASRLQLPI